MFDSASARRIDLGTDNFEHLRELVTVEEQ